MQAYIYKNYGKASALELTEVEAPIPRENEVLVKNHALSINPAEWHKLTGSVWMVRLSAGLFRPKHQILGADVAGIVMATGDKVKDFNIGDRVFGRCLSAGLAELCCVEESGVATIPEGISFEQAAALPLASVTALIALRDKGKIKDNQKVLINGASGGIGTFAVQLAKHLKAHVTGVCCTDNTDLVKSLGADEVIDYKKKDLKLVSSQFDLIIDLVGNKKATTFAKLLKYSGKCVLIGMDSPKRLFRNMFQGMFISAFSSKDILPMDAEVKSDDLTFMAQLVLEGKIQPVIGKRYAFKCVPEAFAQLGTRRSRGKLVIRL